MVNLELLLKFGPKAWRVHNACLAAVNSRCMPASWQRRRIDSAPLNNGLDPLGRGVRTVIVSGGACSMALSVVVLRRLY